ncbi:MAG TPA: DEAD/DEAH box helicase, partial [Burkholderiales bacterium]|nr:DEAD/DEAH box helicase [Burkholderiales bacterium]
KTFGFGIPVVQRLGLDPAPGVKALIVVPTRELAVQVYEDMDMLTSGRPTNVVAIYGGKAYEGQIDQLKAGAQIVVGTPGRVLDHLARGTVDFSKLSFVVLDEADRMLDMGFLPDIKRIIALLPAQRQNLLFSATFPEEIRALVKSLLRDPAEVQVAARNAVADLVSHVVHPVKREKKRELLAYLIQTRDLRQVLVFTGTRIGANRLAHQLRRDRIQADAIHGDKTQAEREAALADFKSGKTAVLVATDVASRGLDIEGLPQVINFDVPHSPEDYVHRIGRTGRAGMTGEAISLVAPEDMEALAAIERLIKKKLERVLVPGFQPSGPSVATLMGDQPSKKGKRPAPLPADPIFSKPYEPSASPTPKSEAPELQKKRREPQVAALLGGLKR